MPSVANLSCTKSSSLINISSFYLSPSDQKVADQELTVDSIMRFLEERNFPASNAEKLGIGLGLPSEKVSEFKRENPDLEEVLIAVVGHWLHSNPDKSWDKLAESCDYANLADDIQGNKPTLLRKRTGIPEYHLHL